MLHQPLHRHTEELLFAQWSSLPKQIKAGKEQVEGSRRENPKADAWSRAAPNNVCYTNGVIPHHVCETSTQRDNCMSPAHTEGTEETLHSQTWKQQRHLYECSTTLVLLVFIQPQEMVTEHVTCSFGWAQFQSMGFEHMPRLPSKWTNLHRALHDWLFFSFQMVGTMVAFNL